MRNQMQMVAIPSHWIPCVSYPQQVHFTSFGSSVFLPSNRISNHVQPPRGPTLRNTKDVRGAETALFQGPPAVRSLPFMQTHDRSFMLGRNCGHLGLTQIETVDHEFLSRNDTNRDFQTGNREGLTNPETIACEVSDDLT